MQTLKVGKIEFLNSSAGLDDQIWVPADQDDPGIIRIDIFRTEAVNIGVDTDINILRSFFVGGTYI